MRIEVRIVAIKCRAIRTDNFRSFAHVEEHVGVVERRLFADAHELGGADFDDRHAGCVMKVGNNPLRHDPSCPGPAARRDCTRGVKNAAACELAAPYRLGLLISSANGAQFTVPTGVFGIREGRSGAGEGEIDQIKDRASCRRIRSVSI
jgi:hypothetical protein